MSTIVDTNKRLEQEIIERVEALEGQKMNIEHRLTKLEAGTPGNDSEFCGCSPFRKSECYFQKGVDGIPANDAGPMPTERETCERCQKPIDKLITVIQFVAAGDKPFPPNPDASTFNIETRLTEN